MRDGAARRARRRLGDSRRLGRARRPEQYVAAAGTTSFRYVYAPPWWVRFLGAKVCLQDVWDVHEAAALIEAEECAWTVGATPFLQGLLEPALADRIQSLQIFRCGGADVPPQLIRRARTGHPRDADLWVQQPSTISGGVNDDPAKAAITDGRVHAQNRVRIIDLDDDNHVLKPGEVGEIQSRGDKLLLGYVDHSLNAEAFTTDGWFRTGDLGHLDPDGYITVGWPGRRASSSAEGENISAKEVEDLILDLPHVRQCAVVGVRDVERGELMVAACVLADGAHCSLDEITDHLQRVGIAPQKFPERLEIIDQMPMNAAGKILKVALRARFSIPSEA